jgi:hypothetical protein
MNTFEGESPCQSNEVYEISAIKISFTFFFPQWLQVKKDAKNQISISETNLIFFFLQKCPLGKSLSAGLLKLRVYFEPSIARN